MFLVVMNECLTVKPLKTVFFCTKISYSIKNYVHHAKKIHIRKLKMVILMQKHYNSCTPTSIDLIGIVKKHNTLITINCGRYLCILEFSIQSL